MEVRQLNTLIRAAQFQSFSKAAESLGYSQSAVTVQIKALEEELGVRLFDRMNKRVLLTVDGQRFLEYANSILDTIQSARQALNENAELDGSLHIGTLESLCFFRLPGLIRQFRLEHPRVGLRVTTGSPEELIEKMEQGEVDLVCILDEPRYSNNWHKCNEVPEEVVFVATPNIDLGHPGPYRVAELLDKLEERFGTSDTGITPVVREYDLLVAGGGPAGASAAIYAARKGLRVAVVAEKVGGQVNETVGIENLVSVPRTTGAELAGDLRRHMEAYGIDICDNRRIERFDMDGGIRELHAKGGEVFRAPALVVATGASWRRLGVPGEAEYIGRGVAFCPGKHIAVIGGGNSGVEAAIDLAGTCASVTVLEFMETLKADQVLQEKLRTLPNVAVHTNVQTLEVEGDGSRMTALRTKDRPTGAEKRLLLDGVFVQIGLSANSKLFAGILDTNRAGEILTDKECRTSVPGVYAAGDVTDIRYKQIVIAMGEGAKAALSASEDRIKGII